MLPDGAVVGELAAVGDAPGAHDDGGDGVGVLYPAIINDEEIHQDMFLTTDGREGVEALVSGRNDPEAWKYWRP